MRRRAFITLFGGAAAWPLAARAQQTKIPTIGFLGTTTSAAWGPWTTVFMQRLRELGWIDGQNVAIVVRWAEGRSERFAELTAEFVRLNVNVIFTGGTPAIAAKQATSFIPIVFVLASDPVGIGLVASLARPGGNITGLSTQGTDIVGTKARAVGPNSSCFPPIIGPDQRCKSGRNTGGGGGSGERPHGRPRSDQFRNPASRRYRTGVRATQRFCAGALRLCRPTPLHLPRSHQHFGIGSTTTNNAYHPGVSGCLRSDVLCP